MSPYTPFRRLVVPNQTPVRVRLAPLAGLAFLAQQDPALGDSMVSVPDDSASIEAIDPDLVRSSRALPAADESEWHEAWAFSPGPSPPQIGQQPIPTASHKVPAHRVGR